MNRNEHLQQLKTESYDVLIIGAGATGAGAALDAASRGYKVALVERDDFSSGTSSRSTKLIHGGVRYLEQAVKRLDRSQFNLVRDALKERATLIRLAPHLAKPLPLVTPLYNLIEVPYFMTGLKMYDWLAGKDNLHPSRFVDASEALQQFPMLKKEGLRGGVIYYDGQFDDARMNVCIALTAADRGATVCNHVEVVNLTKTEGKLSGAVLKDRLTGDSWSVSAKAIVNATGPFLDAIRKMDDPQVKPMLTASSGIHIMLDKRFSPPGTGLLIPQTEDGRVLFLLPWLGYTLVGTTDNPAAIEDHPKASEDDISYVLRHIEKYFSIPVTRSDVKASWSGLRPLVSDPNAADTAKLSRDHMINTSPSGLITIAGGKWTTYRKMALDTINEAQRVAKLPTTPSQTENILLRGADKFSPTGAAELQEHFGLEPDMASYLNRAYGDRAASIAELMKDGFHERLAQGHAYTQAEVIYAAREESACSTTDVLARRTRLAFLDTAASQEALPVVNQLLTKELGWSEERAQEDRLEAEAYIAS